MAEGDEGDGASWEGAVAVIKATLASIPPLLRLQAVPRQPPSAPGQGGKSPAIRTGKRDQPLTISPFISLFLCLALSPSSSLYMHVRVSVRECVCVSA